jgi:Protein of unknown function (DUF3237)
MTSDLLNTLPAALTQIMTRPLFVMRLSVLPLQVIGATPAAYRRIGVVPYGEFSGERLNGQVLEGGNDWQSVRRDGSVALDVRLVLKTEDHALIGMTYRGIRHGPPEAISRLERGEIIDPSSYYFRIAPLFETESPRYAWLNHIVAIGVGHRFHEGPVYSVFEVL